LSKSRTTVTNTLRLLNLPEQVKKWIGEGKLSAGAARSLLSPNIGDPIQAAKNIIEKGLSVREAELLTQESKKKKKRGQAEAMGPDMRNFLNTLQNIFGTKVECKTFGKNSNKGTLIIHYSSYDDLTRIQQAVT